MSALSVRVLHPIASGGQARVFAAVLESTLDDGTVTRHPVVVKKPHAASDEADVARFAREATHAAAFSSAHVVPVLGVTRHEGVWSLTMPWVEGVDLATLLERGALPARVAVRVVLDVAAGLAALHEHGVTHRDVAPDNVLVGRDGVARIGDLGLAREHAHRTAQLSGKAAYVSPESVRGEPTDARSDVFVLGAILVECIEGRPLFRGASEAETLEHVLHRAAPEQLAGADMLVAVVSRALDKRPAARPVDARAFADELYVEARTAGLLGAPEEVRACVVERCGVAIDEIIARRDEALSALVPVLVSPRASNAAPATQSGREPARRTMLGFLGAALIGGGVAAVGARVLTPSAAPTASPSTASPSTAPVSSTPAAPPGTASSPDTALTASFSAASAAPVAPDPAASRPTTRRDPTRVAPRPSAVRPASTDRAAAPNPYRGSP